MTDQNKAADAAKENAAKTGDAGKAGEDRKLVPVKLLRDVWNEEGARLPKGGEIDLPLDFAKQLIAEGKAERNDPLPGDSK